MLEPNLPMVKSHDQSLKMSSGCFLWRNINTPSQQGETSHMSRDNHPVVKSHNHPSLDHVTWSFWGILITSHNQVQESVYPLLCSTCQHISMLGHSSLGQVTWPLLKNVCPLHVWDIPSRHMMFFWSSHMITTRIHGSCHMIYQGECLPYHVLSRSTIHLPSSREKYPSQYQQYTHLVFDTIPIIGSNALIQNPQYQTQRPTPSDTQSL